MTATGSYGTVLTYGANAAVAWIGWRYNETEGSPRDVPNQGRAARLVSQAKRVDGKAVCSVHLDVLDSNPTLSTSLGTDANMPSRLCDDPEVSATTWKRSATTWKRSATIGKRSATT
ncbi:MAG: hypothetical protein SYR96_37085 [Actinomycetota bacterium]|nr:hypothetical protein [Actinomycetota bacterium]